MPKGFTLIELLVVISIIAILSVIGITVFSGVQNSARISGATQTVRAVGMAMKLFTHETGNCPYPIHYFDGSSDPVPGLLAAMPSYITNIPAKDPWGMSWRYHCHPGSSTSGECTCFFSSGPNKTMTADPWDSCKFLGDDIGWCIGQPSGYTDY